MALSIYFDPYHQEPDTVASVVESSAIQLGTPTLALTSTGQTTISAVIGSVEQAGGYILQVGTNPAITANVKSFYTESLTNTITGLVLNTLYYGKAIAIGSGFLNSNAATDSVTTDGLPNQAPIVDAGNSTSVNLPTASMALNGTATDTDGSISSVLWEKVSGDASITITNSTNLTATLNNPSEIAGAVVVRLTATDNLGLTATDTVTKTWNYVNPQVNAGSDINITLPTNSGTLTATSTAGSYPIVTTAWSKVSGSGTITTGGAYSGLTAGVSVFKVVVTDSKGVTAEDSVSINVAVAPANIQWGLFSTSPASEDLSSLVFAFNKDVTAGATSYQLDMTSAVFTGDKYIAIKEPSSEPAKTAWFNTGLNSEPAGSMPGYVYGVTVTGGFRYYYTNAVAAIDGSTSLVTYSVS